MKRSLSLAAGLVAGVLLLAASVTGAHGRGHHHGHHHGHHFHHGHSGRFFFGTGFWAPYSSFCGYPDCTWGSERVYIPPMRADAASPCTRYFVSDGWWWRDTGFACARPDGRFDLFPDP
jgi:hypothetical protein